MKTKLLAILLMTALSASGQDWLKGNEPDWFTRVQALAASTPTPTTNSFLNLTNAVWTNPKDYHVYDSTITFHCTHEPIVKKNGSEWTIRFKK